MLKISVQKGPTDVRAVLRKRYSARVLLGGALAAGGDQARRAFAAMMTMPKIDVAAIDAARRE